MSEDKPMSKPDSGEAPPPTLTFFYEKSSQFRVIHVDGAHGGPSPDGSNIVMSLFSERRPIPKEEEFFWTPNGPMGEMAKPPVKREGIMREVDICAIMDERVARTLVLWLLKHIQALEELQKSQASSSK